MRFETMSAREFSRIIGLPGYIIVDLRNKDDYTKWHIEGAVNIPYEKLSEEKMYLKHGIKVIFYCERGNLSIIAANKLALEGYNTFSLVGGINEYKKRILD